MYLSLPISGIVSFVIYRIGMPAVSVPVRRSENGQPVELQLIGLWWREDIMLRVATT